MKKSLLTIVALGAMLGSCSNDETLDMTARQAITFDDVFVENSTRAIDNSYTSAGLSQFEVYGTITNSSNQTANLFEHELVEKKNNQWVYNEAHTQYWIPGNTYNFTAIADGNIEGVTQVDTDTYGMPTKIHLKDASTQTDILYAKSSPIFYQSGDGAKTVAFTFSHLLAKAKFTVKNSIEANSDYNYKVEEIKIINAVKDAIYENSSWILGDNTYDLEFGAIVDEDEEDADTVFIAYGEEKFSNYERLLIPVSNKDITISLTYSLYKGDVLVQKVENKEYIASNITLAAGNAYNLVIKLGNPGEKIQFTVTNVNGWETNNNTNNVNVNN